MKNIDFPNSEIKFIKFRETMSSKVTNRPMRQINDNLNALKEVVAQNLEEIIVIDTDFEPIFKNTYILTNSLNVKLPSNPEELFQFTLIDGTDNLDDYDIKVVRQNTDHKINFQDDDLTLDNAKFSLTFIFVNNNWIIKGL